MKVRKKHLTYWLRLTTDFELFLWYRNESYRGFFKWLWFTLNWYPSIGETSVKPWKYDRYMWLADLLVRR